MAAKKIFVASSSEAIPYAKAFTAACKNQKVISYVRWWEEFRAGRTLIEELERFKGTLQGAIIILTPDCEATIRRKKHFVPNLNVLFEFGYFFGALPRKNVAIVKYGDVFLPSDLDGYIPIYGGLDYDRKKKKKVAPPPSTRTKDEFFRWLENLE
jgi:predicted nucleotide-binding protein